MSIDLVAAEAIVPKEAHVVESQALSSIDLANATKVSPEPAPVKLGGIARAGVTLVKWVLIMMSIFVLLAVVWVWTSEAAFSGRVEELIRPSTVETTKAILEPLLKERTAFRDFWLKIFQMVLLNVLLPVLTSLLGYIFGSSRDPNKA